MCSNIRLKMSEKKFIKKRHILIFILLIVLLHLVLYVISEFRFNENGLKKPIILLAVYSKSKEISITNLRSLLERLFANGSTFGQKKIDNEIKTVSLVNETDLAAVVDR
ncbi:uncharacterized protein LOC123529425 [Mercenaria mercenaria]|uniref:uncharacterized protein LOC123529425 n=1 Tax=Mercenaria mercenaria TaxID=6596 RepID=UPI00234F69BF|nr:uncharacterized protein LOC123529425 [Mercenaria mercenaria]